MLDAYIIDAIRREEAKREMDRDNRIHLEIPMIPPPQPTRAPEDMGDPVVIPLYPEDDAEDTAA